MNARIENMRSRKQYSNDILRFRFTCEVSTQGLVTIEQDNDGGKFHFIHMYPDDAVKMAKDIIKFYKNNK